MAPMSKNGKPKGGPELTLDQWVEAVANRKPRVSIGYVREEDVKGFWADSIFGMFLYDRENHNYIHGTIGLQSGPRIAEARCQVVDEFLSSPLHKSATHLLFIDSDMTPPANTIDVLLETAIANNIGIIGGLCFVGRPGARQYPTIYRAYNEDDGHLAVEPVDDYPDNALVKVGATGGACLLVRRDVFAKMLKAYGHLPDGRINPYPWFSEGLTTSAGKPLGEDIAFCRRAMLLGIDMYVHTGVKVGHLKTAEIGEDTYREYRAKLPQTEAEAVVV